MCGRYVMFSTTETVLAATSRLVGEQVGAVGGGGTPTPSWNIAPTHTVGVLRRFSGAVTLGPAAWGYPAPWRAGTVLFNARGRPSSTKPVSAGLLRACSSWTGGMSGRIGSPTMSAPVLTRGTSPWWWRDCAVRGRGRIGDGWRPRWSPRHRWRRLPGCMIGCRGCSELVRSGATRRWHGSTVRTGSAGLWLRHHRGQGFWGHW